MKKLTKHLSFIKNSPLAAPRIAKGFFKKIILKQQVLRSVEIAVTYNCQCKCDMCYAGRLKQNKRELTIGQIKDIWEQCYKLGAIHVNITGGEPLLRKDVTEIIKVFKPKSTIVSLVTNGLLLTKEKVKELKKAGLNSLQISLDSIYDSEHDELRKVSGCYERLMKGLRYAKEEGIIVCLSSVLSHENVPMFKKILELAEDLNVFLLINTAGVVGGWQDKESCLLDKKEMEECEKIRSHPLSREDNIYNFSGKTECPAGREKIYITAYGDVMPCDRSHEIYGNVLKMPLKEIWKKMYKDPFWASYSKNCKRYIKEYKVYSARTKKLRK